MISVYRYSGTDCITPEIIRRELAGSAEGKDLVFVVPEFAKAQVERMIISSLEDECSGRGSCTVSDGRQIPVLSSFTKGDVVSFITLSGRILDCMGLESAGAGSDIMMRCAIYSILANYSSDFKSFGKLTNRFEYINMLINLLGDFSRYGIRSDELDEAIGASAPFSAEYRNKLEDLRLVMDAVDKMNSQFGLALLKDRISEAARAVMAISDAEYDSRRMAGLRKLLSSRFVFIGFGAGRRLTPQERTLVRMISSKGGDIRFRFPANAGSMLLRLFDSLIRFELCLFLGIRNDLRSFCSGVRQALFVLYLQAVCFFLRFSGFPDLLIRQLSSLFKDLIDRFEKEALDQIHLNEQVEDLCDERPGDDRHKFLCITHLLPPCGCAAISNSVA